MVEHLNSSLAHVYLSQYLEILYYQNKQVTKICPDLFSACLELFAELSLTFVQSPGTS